MDIVNVLFTFGTPVVVLVIVIVSVRSVVPMLKDATKLLQAQTAAANLRATGIPARALVVAIRPTGTLLNHQPECQVDLDVAPPNAPPFRSSILSIVNQVVLPRVQPGLVVPVRIDPGNPRNVVLDV